MQFRSVQISKFTLLQENKQKNGYRVYRWPDANGSQVAFFVNQTYGNPEMRAIFRDLKFRQALSIGINRKRINEVSYFGLGKERNTILIPDSPFYVPELESLNAQYDAAKANGLLDEIGLKKGGDGFRWCAGCLDSGCRRVRTQARDRVAHPSLKGRLTRGSWKPMTRRCRAPRKRSGVPMTT